MFQTTLLSWIQRHFVFGFTIFNLGMYSIGVGGCYNTVKFEFCKWHFHTPSHTIGESLETFKISFCLNKPPPTWEKPKSLILLNFSIIQYKLIYNLSLSFLNRLWGAWRRQNIYKYYILCDILPWSPYLTSTTDELLHSEWEYNKTKIIIDGVVSW